VPREREVSAAQLDAAGEQQGTAILILSHVLDKGVEKMFREVWEDCRDQFSVRFLCDNTRGVFERYRSDSRYVLFTTSQLEGLGYPGKLSLNYQATPEARTRYHKERNFLMGNAELPVLLYYRDNPRFRYYWVVEYDVRYSGSWRQFFLHFSSSRADLLATSLVRFQETPNWPRWVSMKFAGMNIEQRDYIRGFFPIYRISVAALNRVDAGYRAGVGGHHECLMPTMLHHAGLSLEDIGGDGGFVSHENINRFYRNNRVSDSLAPGTFVFRPAIYLPGDQPDTLWHPVKFRPAWRNLASILKRRLFGPAHGIRKSIRKDGEELGH
jgi:hypothetical protein